MSRSYRKVFSHQNTDGPDYLDKWAKKNRKEGKPIRKTHERSMLQTEQDYIGMAEAFLKDGENKFETTYGGKLKAFLNGKKLTSDLAEEFGKTMYRKDRSR